MAKRRSSKGLPFSDSVRTKEQTLSGNDTPLADVRWRLSQQCIEEDFGELERPSLENEAWYHGVKADTAVKTGLGITSRRSPALNFETTLQLERKDSSLITAVFLCLNKGTDGRRAPVLSESGSGYIADTRRWDTDLRMDLRRAMWKQKFGRNQTRLSQTLTRVTQIAPFGVHQMIASPRGLLALAGILSSFCFRIHLQGSILPSPSLTVVLGVQPHSRLAEPPLIKVTPFSRASSLRNGPTDKATPPVFPVTSTVRFSIDSMDSMDVQGVTTDHPQEGQSDQVPQEAKNSVSDMDGVRHDDQSPENDMSPAEASSMASDNHNGVNNPEPSSSTRPLTRSRSGRASKPPVRDDSWYDAPKKNSVAATGGTAGRKKGGGKAPRKRTIDEVDKDKAESEEPPARTRPPPAETAVPAEVLPTPPQVPSPPPAGSAAVFVAMSGMPPAPPAASHSPYYVDPLVKARARTSLPVPVPNLIKKSRGRRVPVVPLSTTSLPSSSASSTSPSSHPPAEHGPPVSTSDRVHICTVPGCGKAFHRGEHLKRHIRSIHTHEKPFACTYEGCRKFFNRHDNLLQHVKVHRAGGAEEEGKEGGKAKGGTGGKRKRGGSRRKSRQVEEEDEDVDVDGIAEPDEDDEDAEEEEEDGEGEYEDDEDADARRPTLSPSPPPAPDFYSRAMTRITYPTLGAAPTPPLILTREPSLQSYAAVSSLRTELPESPSKAGGFMDREREEQQQQSMGAGMYHHPSYYRLRPVGHGHDEVDAEGEPEMGPELQMHAMREVQV